MSPQLPKALERVGIKRIESNLQPGQQVVLPDGLIFAVFGDEIIEELRKRHATKQEQKQCKVAE